MSSLILTDIQSTETILNVINWDWLSGNTSAISLLEANIDRINWNAVLGDSAIPVYDYDDMKTSKKDLHRNLMECLFHPIKISKYLETHDDVDNYMN